MDNKKQKMNDLVVTIELTLMSVIQGVALFFLADNVRASILSFDYQHWIYIPVAFMFLIIFWAQVLVHIMSFISWPIELIHNFLYFLVVITEVIMFSNIGNPLNWFGANILFFIVVGILYAVDFSLMKKKGNDFQDSQERKQFYADIMHDQRLGMYTFVPTGIIFAALSLFAIKMYPMTFIDGNWHIALGAVQAIVGLCAVSYLVSVFKKRFITIGEI